MKFEIRSVNTRYSEGELVDVSLSYLGRDSERRVNVSGTFELTAEEYAGNEAIAQLEELSKNHALSVINGEIN
ncbi:hypothetical protein SAMN05421839_10583 [Halolactibacillus halophilus]|uniref:Uncharacterized protein n=1 Tax=Halolactibacillus halophilus TaxID=306540 RepID=A0A1I5MIJ8_9BACI|nr:hypothetical protein [Halolactibacillus halophilus]GEM02975.1 hypothetical protein HHA03_25070 [Halolactibacillus halophilus]SFP08776.1 hypothetical protein SAMN05421839_10583 [Halolactibacillus halophilus]